MLRKIKIMNKLCLFILLVFLLFQSNTQILLASEANEEAEPTPFKVKSIPREIETVRVNGSWFFPFPDSDWHNSFFHLVNNSYNLIKEMCKGNNSYNVATFKLRFFWEDSTKNEAGDLIFPQARVQEVPFDDRLFLSKMDLEALRINLDNSIPYGNKAAVLELLKSQGDNQGVDLKKILDLVCFGDFFPSIGSNCISGCKVD